MSTIEIEIPTLADIYIQCVQKNVLHPPEGKCHVLHWRCRTRALVPRSQTHLPKGSFGGKDLAMPSREQMKSEKRRTER